MDALYERHDSFYRFAQLWEMLAGITRDCYILGMGLIDCY
jgi:hypothetical protein